MSLSPAAVETLPETPAPGVPADTQEAARRDGAETPEGFRALLWPSWRPKWIVW